MTKRRLWVVEVWDGWNKEWCLLLPVKITREEARKQADIEWSRSFGRSRTRVVSYEPSPKVMLKFTGGEVVSLGKPSR